VRPRREIFHGGVRAIKGNAGVLEFAPQSGEKPRSEFLEKKGQFRAVALADEGEEIGQFGGVLIGEVLVDYRLVAALPQQHGPKAVARGIGGTEDDLAVEPGPRDPRGEIAEPLVGEGEIGEARLPQQRIALMEEFVEFHGGDFLAASERGRLHWATVGSSPGGVMPPD
jgi:hypothetical protein